MRRSNKNKSFEKGLTLRQQIGGHYGRGVAFVYIYIFRVDL